MSLPTRSLAVLLSITAAASAGAADPVRIVDWNCGGIFAATEAELPANLRGQSPGHSVAARASDLAAFAADRKPDVVLLQEVTSRALVEKIAAAMGFTSPHIACSNFAPGDSTTQPYNALEVAIISRHPLANVTEYDRSVDGQGGAGDPAEVKLERPDLQGIANTGVGRGFLVADVTGLDLTLIVTHLKSSGGGSGAQDRANAQKRELVAAAIGEYAAGRLAGADRPTVLVAGDFNVGETDVSKNGTDLTEDNNDPDNGDGYDDTHAVLTAGVFEVEPDRPLRMSSLTAGIGEETFDSTDFPGSGPIDVIYVAGPRRPSFTLAEKASDTFGSDHFAVTTLFLQAP